MKYDLICVDMFQTLVDTGPQIPLIWQQILKEKYDLEIAEKCVKLVSQRVVNGFHDWASKEKQFYNLRHILFPYFAEIAIETKLNFDVNNAVDIFLHRHGYSANYDDVTDFFESVGERIPICLVSDADTVMIEPLLSRFRFDNVFISEDVKSYKNDPESRMFLKVLEHYQYHPTRILHIGDSSSDIIGANKAGIVSCWINRNDSPWQYKVNPDFVIRSLSEVVDLII